MSSGGGLPLGRGLVRLHSLAVNGRDALSDFGQQLGRVEPPERALGDQQSLPDDRRRILDLLVALRRRRAQPDGREGRLDRVRRAQVLPVRLRELVEGDQPVPILVEDMADGGDALLRAPRLERPLLGTFPAHIYGLSRSALAQVWIRVNVVPQRSG
jgi:hypothetical protein